MPLTPLHFGPNAAISLPLHKYLDVPVFLLVNVVIDIEPFVVLLFNLNYPLHGIFHTFLFASLLGILLSFIIFLSKELFVKLMKVAHFPYKPNLYNMIAAGVLGALLHVFLDSIYHSDIQPFYPVPLNPFYGLISQNFLVVICISCFFLALGFYLIIVYYPLYQKKRNIINHKQ